MRELLTNEALMEALADESVREALAYEPLIEALSFGKPGSETSHMPILQVCPVLHWSIPSTVWEEIGRSPCRVSSPSSNLFRSP